MTIKDYAALYRRSERTIKRWKAQGLPLDDEDEMRRIMSLQSSRLGCGKNVRRAPIATPKPQPVEDDYNHEISALANIHFELVKLAWKDDEPRERLGPVFDITRPYIEEPED